MSDTRYCTHTGNSTICDACMGRPAMTPMEAQAMTLDERAQRIIRTLRPTDPGSWDANQFYVVAELTDAYAQGRRAGLEKAVVIAEGSRITPVMREATSYYNAACLDVARVIRQQAQAAQEEGT